MADIVHNKLVRDKIPKIIQRNGDEAVWRTLSTTEFIPALIKKLVEEAQEVQQASSVHDLVIELADLQEVYGALLCALKLDEADIDRVRSQRLAERGGFEQRIFLVKTTKAAPR